MERFSRGLRNKVMNVDRENAAEIAARIELV
jgi:hypothetical protein